MPATVIPIGEPAHEDERAALKFLADGLPDGTQMFANPWLVEPSGTVYELDAVVVMPHAIFIVEIKGWRGHLSGATRDWYVPQARRSPLLLARKTAQVLHSLLARRSYEAGQAWVQELVFLPAAASFHTESVGVRPRVALRREIHPMLADPDRIPGLQSRQTGPADSDEVVTELMQLLRGTPKQPPMKHVAGFEVVDHFDANERFSEVLGKDTTGTHRLLRIYRMPWDATEAERARLRKRATWEAAVLRSLGRAPEDVCLPTVDAPVETELGLVVPMEHFEGETLPQWLETKGEDLPLAARVGLWARIAKALSWTHKAGVVHRHLRPDHVLLRGEADPRDPHTPAYRVTGFDIAKRRDHHTTVAWSQAGTGDLEGAAPEVLHALSDAVPASDQFSLGLLLAHLVARRPLVESTVALIERRHRMPHLRDLDPDVPQRLDDAVARMLERKPTDRFRSVDEAVEQVLAALAKPVGAPKRGLAPGDLVGSDYLVEKPLGSGGLSDVYQVKHKLLGDRFALKVARPTRVAERAIQCEFHALNAVSHPAVVRAHGLTSMVEDRITLRLDLVPGSTLTDAVREATLPEADLLARRRLAEDLLAALDEFERIGLSHNDLKPDNLMVTPEGRLVLLDFSLAQSPAVEAKMGKERTFGGTFDWRDPSGEAPGHGTDRYAAAMCLFWLHAGRHPFDGRVPEPEEGPDFDAAELEPESLAGFFAQALHLRPTERFGSARAMRDAYLAALGARSPERDTSEVVLATDTPLTQVGLPQRAVRCLDRARVGTLGELLALGAARLQRVAGLGPALQARVQAVMATAQEQGVQAADVRDPEGPPFFKPLADSKAPISELALERGVADSLRTAGMLTLGDVASRPRAALLRLPRIGTGSLTKVAEALVEWQKTRSSKGPVDTLDALWAACSKALDDDHRAALDKVFGLHGPRQLQGPAAEQLGIDQPTVSTRKHDGLAQLDLRALDPAARALDGYLDVEHGVVPMAVASARMARDLPAAAVEPAAIVRILAALDTHSFHVLDELAGCEGEVLARTWVTRDMLTRFAAAMASIVRAWPPESVAAARTTLQMVLPDFQGDPVLLGQCLLPSVATTAAGALFQPPLDVDRAVLYALEGARGDLSHADLAAELDRLFSGLAPPLPPLHSLARLLADSPWKVQADRIVRRQVVGKEAVPGEGDRPHEFLRIDCSVDPIDRVRDVLREAGRRGSSFRLVVVPPEEQHTIARSLVDQLGATAIDLADAWFNRHASTLKLDAKAQRFAALAVATRKRLDALVTELVAQHGAPGRTIVLHNTGILGPLDGLEQVRLLYDRVQGQGAGFWILVVPGLVRQRQPFFNEKKAVWHQPGLVLPLAKPLRP